MIPGQRKDERAGGRQAIVESCNGSARRFSRTAIIMTTAILITWLLVIILAVPVRLVYVQVHPFQTTDIRLLSTDALIQMDAPKEVFFDLRAQIVKPMATQVTFSIRPSSEGIWYKQPSCKVMDGLVLTTAQLGSPEFPLIKNEEYAFRLTSAAGDILMDGQITATVRHLAGTDSRVIMGIGLMASVLQIVLTLFGGSNRSE